MLRKLTTLFLVLAGLGLAACSKPAPEAPATPEASAAATPLEQAAKESDAKGEESARKRAYRYRPAEVPTTDPDALRPWADDQAKQDPAKADGESKPAGDDTQH